MKKAYLNWSSGKDAALALYKLQEQNEYSIEKLVTTVNSDVNRISMHGVRIEMLKKQAENIGLPLQQIKLNGEVSMQEYTKIMETETNRLLQEGFVYSVFGDILLEDLKRYRENQLEKVGLKAIFPLWQEDTTQLLKEFIDKGFKAIVVCVNTDKLNKSFCGRVLDESFLNDLPKDVDPCGENGEFHTFVFDGPIFKEPIRFKIGELVEKSYKPAKNSNDNCFTENQKSWDTSFVFCDLLLE
ncbi:Dph6-related ATP pyrophosphatase [Salegentibacter maritimus]|uniref:Dph6-related ATP pyrophosphatase n=1 Tax=Salegentibacter maritimus TaxID=2794347 RepID=UPI0018E4D534|nr:diphthine--ammonia ligase [Salegentibacter maritimus]MBI6117024.1 diphthine--ammonia ligase [Salegentibacter maritimus]